MNHGDWLQHTPIFRKTTIAMQADLVLRNFHLLTMDLNHGPYGLVNQGAVVVHDGTIQWFGKSTDLEDLADDKHADLQEPTKKHVDSPLKAPDATEAIDATPSKGLTTAASDMGTTLHSQSNREDLTES